MQSRDRLTKGARFVVRVAWFANRGFLLACAAGLMLSWVSDAWFANLLAPAIPPSEFSSGLTGLRLTLLLGIVMAVAIDRLFVALSEIIATASAGDPFVGANTGRLHRIGWCLLALQLLEIPGALIARTFPAMGSAAPNADISVTGWLAVLMTFVLARVFAAGSAMRDELEGTV